jgi:hypothetical protein
MPYFCLTHNNQKKIKMAKQNRDIRRTFRFNKSEDEKLTKLAESKDQNQAEWIRERIKRAKVK